jgi:Ca-activated chloride channel family protein
LAKEKWIKIYTVGLGNLSGWYIEYQDFFWTRKQWVNGVDEKTLKSIAQLTNWKYFNAADNDSFNKTFEEIAWLEKNEIKIQSQKIYSDFYKPFWIVLLSLLWLFLILNITHPEKN